jgi:hypothetical protein
LTRVIPNFTGKNHIEDEIKLEEQASEHPTVYQNLP